MFLLADPIMFPLQFNFLDIKIIRCWLHLIQIASLRQNNWIHKAVNQEFLETGFPFHVRSEVGFKFFLCSSQSLDKT